MVAKWNRSDALRKALDIEALKQPLSQELIDEYNATPPVELPPPTPGGPHYWSGYDRVIENIAKDEDERANRPKPKDQREAWSRLHMARIITGPLLRVAGARRDGVHVAFHSYWPMNFGMPMRHCTCGLILDAPDIFDPSRDPSTAASVDDDRWPADEREASFAQRAFLDAPGHIDWRMLDPENYALDDELEDDDEDEDDE